MKHTITHKLLVVLTFILFAVAMCSNAQDVQEDFETIVVGLEQKIQENPGETKYMVSLATVYLLNRKNAEAIQVCEIYNRTYEPSRDIYSILGSAYFSLFVDSQFKDLKLYAKAGIYYYKAYEMGCPIADQWFLTDHGKYFYDNYIKNEP